MVVAQLCAISPRVIDSTYSCSSPEAFSSFYLDSGGGGGGGGCASPPGLAPLAPTGGRAPAAERAPAWNASSPAVKGSDIPVLRRLGHGGSSSGGGGSSSAARARGRGGLSSSATKEGRATGDASDAVGTPRNSNDSAQEWGRRHHRRQVTPKPSRPSEVYSIKRTL